VRKIRDKDGRKEGLKRKRREGKEKGRRGEKKPGKIKGERKGRRENERKSFEAGGEIGTNNLWSPFESKRTYSPAFLFLSITRFLFSLDLVFATFLPSKSLVQTCLWDKVE